MMQKGEKMSNNIDLTPYVTDAADYFSYRRNELSDRQLASLIKDHLWEESSIEVSVKEILDILEDN